MLFNDDHIDHILETTGQLAIVDDGTAAGLSLWCSFIDPEYREESYGPLKQDAPALIRVRSSAVALLVADGISGTELSTGGTEYIVRDHETVRGGFTLLVLEEVIE